MSTIHYTQAVVWIRAFCHNCTILLYPGCEQLISNIGVFNLVANFNSFAGLPAKRKALVYGSEASPDSICHGIKTISLETMCVAFCLVVKDIGACRSWHTRALPGLF